MRSRRSRARRRVFEHDHGTLGMILGGHLVMSDVDQLAGRVVLVDPVTVRELLDDVAGDGPVEVRVSLRDGLGVLSAPVNVDLPPFDGRPLHALASSLQSYAGSAVERLAASQVLVDRQGATFSVEEGRILVGLPLGDSR